MLPPFIIEQIRRLEEEKRRQQQREQLRIEIPIERHRRPPPDEPRREDHSERGVVILDLM